MMQHMDVQEGSPDSEVLHDYDIMQVSCHIML